MKSSSLWIAVSLVLAAISSCTRAFQIPPPRLSPISTPKSMSLGSSRAYDDGEPAIQAAVVPREDLSWIDLPKSNDSWEKGALPSAEIVIGRIAMVGALSLFLNEILYGKSVLEQFMEAFGMTH